MSIKFNDVFILVILGLLLFFAPKITLGAIDYIIPVTLTPSGSNRTDIICDIPPYNESITFRSYKVGTSTKESGNLTSQPDSGEDTNIACTFAFFINDGGEFGGSIELPLNETIYFTLYQNSDYTNPYGYYTLFRATSTGAITSQFIVNQGIENDTSTRFDSITFATSTGEVTVTGYINDQWNNTNTRLTFNQSNVLYGNWQQSDTIITSSGSFSETFEYVTVTATSTEGFNSQTFDFKLYNYTGCESEGFGAEWFCPDGQPILASTSTVFTLNPDDDLVLNGQGIASLIATTTCSISSIDGCMRNVMLWAFTMSTTSAQRYDTVQQLLRMKAPTGYFFTVSDTLRGVSATSTPTFAYTLPDWLKTNIFTPIRIGLSALVLWWFLGFFYKRVSKIQL